MAIGIIPMEADLTQGRKGWLTMNQADEMVCKLFNEPINPKHYCRGWFDSFWYFDWCNVKSQYRFESNFGYAFDTADEAVLHFFKNSIYLSEDMELWKSVSEAQTYVKHIEPIIRMFYNKGYKIVSLNIG